MPNSNYLIKKLNYSQYHEADFILKDDPNSIKTLKDGEFLELDGLNVGVEVLATPGHDSGCLSYMINDYLFTGDSFIPGIKTITNFKGNKKQALESEEKIKSLAEEKGLIICPGHGEIANGLLTSL